MKRAAAWGAAAIGVVAVYLPVLSKLVSDWAHDDNYSHGFVIVPFAGFLAWERRGRLSRTSSDPSWIGLVVVVFGLALLLLGQLGAELFLTRISLLVVMTGGLAFLRGWSAVRIMAFPLAFLLLMIPIPAIVFNQVAFPLQLLASDVGARALSLLHIPVLREGNLIMLANTTLEVAEACSGIRSLISLLTLGVIYGYFLDERAGLRTFVALATVPIAIVANGLRVAGTGVAAHYVGPRAAEGFLHAFSGWLMFVLAFGLLFLCGTVVRKIWPEGRHGTLTKEPA